MEPDIFFPLEKETHLHTMNFSVPCQFSRVLFVFFHLQKNNLKEAQKASSLNCDLYVPTVGIGKSTQFSRGSYTQYEDSLFKGGMTIPAIATFDPDTYGTSNLGRLCRCDFSDFMERHGVIQKKVASLHELFYLINILSTNRTIERKKDFVADYYYTPIEPNSFGANLIADLVNR